MLAALGQQEQALELLERESTRRSAMFSTLAAEPQARTASGSALSHCDENRRNGEMTSAVPSFPSGSVLNH
jgi:hypothetical protein